GSLIVSAAFHTTFRSRAQPEPPRRGTCTFIGAHTASSKSPPNTQGPGDQDGTGWPPWSAHRISGPEPSWRVIMNTAQRSPNTQPSKSAQNSQGNDGSWEEKEGSQGWQGAQQAAGKGKQSSMQGTEAADGSAQR